MLRGGLTRPLLNLPWDARGIFRARPNRFLGVVDITDPRKSGGVRVHIHDPGRLRELLYAGNRVLLKRARGNHRATEWNLAAARHGGDWILVHSGYHRTIAEAIIRDEDLTPFGRVVGVRSEITYSHSRLDFLLINGEGREVWVEVKGCTLAAGELALFPDAPTKRGNRHLKELISLKRNGDLAAPLILIFRPEVKQFAPNGGTDPAFYSLFYEAMERGVEVYPLLLEYREGKIGYLGRVPVLGRA